MSNLPELTENTFINLDQLLNSFTQGIIIKDKDHKIIFANSVADEFLGVAAHPIAEEKVLNTSWTFTRENGSTIALDDFPDEVALNTQKDQKGVLGVIKPSGDVKWLEYNAKVIQAGDDDNQNPFTISTFTDITNLRKRVDQLQIFKNATGSASDLILITDAEGTIVYVNAIAEKITGFSLTDMIGEKAGSSTLWGGLMDKAFYENMWNIIKVQKKSFEGEIQNKRKNGERYTTGISISPVLDDMGNVTNFIAIERDITEVKRMEATKNELDSFFKLSVDMLCIINRDHYFEKVSPSFLKILGWDKQKIKSTSFIDFTHEEDREQTEKDFLNLVEGEHIIDFKNRFMEDSGDYIWISWSAVKTNDGKIYAIARNITEQERIDKLKSDFISLASHQLRTPLSSVKWYVELLQGEEEENLSNDQKEFIKEIGEGSKRMIKIIDDLLNVSRIETGTYSVDPQPTDIKELISSVVGELQVQLSEKKQQVETVYGNISTVSVDQNIMKIVLHNLLTNAVRYSPNESTILLTADRDINDYTLITVRDKGIGIPEGEKDNIFKKMYRAENSKQHVPGGSGLGLYLIKSIIEESNGKIWFESKENEGTIFFLLLPPEGMKKKEGTRELTV